MPRIVDIHPDDGAAREQLRANLVELRSRCGMTQRQLSDRTGIAQPWIVALEHKSSWLMGTLNRWSGGLNRRVVLTPHRLPDPGPPDVETVLLQALPPSPTRDLALLLDHLRRVRVEMGVSLRTLSSRMGVGESAAGQWELGNDDVRLASAQRWTRALGGVLLVDLREVSGG